MLQRVLVLLSLALSLASCASYKAVATFGDATSGFADQMAQTAAGTYAVCVDSNSVKLDLDFVTGVAVSAPRSPDPNSVTSTLAVCESYAKTGQLYARVAGQLGAFGEAMAALAEGGDADYTQQVGELSTAATDLVPSLKDKQALIDGANKLAPKIIGWFSKGYSSKHIAEALKESKADVQESLSLLEAVLGVLDEQANQYQSNIEKVATAQDYELKKQGTHQAALVEKHLPRLQTRKLLLASTGASLKHVREVHSELVKEAERTREEFDLETLVAKAKELQAIVLEHKALVDQLRRTM